MNDKIRKKRGYILKGHKILAEHDPDLLEAYDSYFEKVMVRSTSLDRKTKELIVLAILAARGLFSPFKLHATKAIELGASIDEIIDAVSISGLYAGAPSMLYALDSLPKHDWKSSKMKSKTSG